MNLPARLLSILLTIVWGGLTYLMLVATEDDPASLQGIVSFGLALLACAALLAAWRWPRAGGWTAVAAGIMCFISSVPTMTTGVLALAGLWIALPFVLTGLLFVATGEARAGRLRLSRTAAALISVAVVVIALALVAMTLGLGITA